MEIVTIATYIFSFLTILAELCIVVILLAVFFQTTVSKIILKFFAKNALLIGLLVALTATLGSLFYSEIAHFTPCKLCWYQRILMYPQTLLFAVAYLKKDKSISLYAALLSILGA